MLKNAIEAKRLRSENLEFKKQFQAKSVIVGDSIPMKALRQQIALMAPTNGRVLIYGESGTGKELAARAIHAQSLRKDAMFVEVNCAAIPEDLIESELFGHRKGAFPGAAADKEGKFQKADGGTLFLDEVGDMSLKTQSKVLRTLDEGRFAPVGEEEAGHRGCAGDRRHQQRPGRRNLQGQLPRRPLLPPERDSLLRAAACASARKTSRN